MEMYGSDDETIVEEVVYADFICNNCDTPGARKISGVSGHSADINPCPWCRCFLIDTDRPKGYNILGTTTVTVQLDAQLTVLSRIFAS